MLCLGAGSRAGFVDFRVFRRLGRSTSLWRYDRERFEEEKLILFPKFQKNAKSKAWIKYGPTCVLNQRETNRSNERKEVGSNQSNASPNNPFLSLARVLTSPDSLKYPHLLASSTWCNIRNSSVRRRFF